MDKRIYILGVFIIGIVLLMSLVSAATDYRVAYIYKTKTDTKIVNLFTDLRLKVDLIKESSLPQDLSSYKFIFVGDENFAKDIPIDKYPSVLMNHYIPEKVGLSDSGISSLVSTMPLQVNFNGDQVTVYGSAKNKNGIAIPYYYLDKQNKATSLEQFAGTYTTSSGVNFGDVISLGAEGNKLVNGNTLQNNLCFFGISKTDYWTSGAETLFKECIKYVYDYTTIPGPVITCTLDSDCGINQLIDSPFCSNNNVFKNFITFKCNTPGTEESYCSNGTSVQLVQSCSLICLEGKCSEVTCNSNTDCDDGNSTTEDVCINSNATDSICIHNIYNTYIKLVSFVAIPSQNSVALNFSALADNNTLVKGYLLSSDRQKWILVTSPVTGYIFNGLTPSTNYIFYAKAIDNKNIPSDEMNISVRTLDVPVVTPPATSNSGGGGGGGGNQPISGGFSYCTIKWECSSWSECKDGKQTRVCSYPSDKCKPEQDKPVEAQSCVETPVTTIPETTNLNTGTENNDTNEAKPNSITGAAIADLLGKYSWVSVIAVLAIVGIAYYFVRKFIK